MLSSTSLSLAVNEQYVYVLQGYTLYQLDAKHLKELNRVKLKIARPRLPLPGPPGRPPLPDERAKP